MANIWSDMIELTDPAGEPGDNLAQSSEGAGTDIRAVSRVAQVLGLFAPTQPQLSAAAVATQLHLNRTTAYRYCMSLAAAQILDRLDNGEFTPGRILLQLGAFALGRRDVLTVAPRHLRALSRTTRAAAVLSLWGSTGPVVSAVAEDTHRDVVVTVRVGTHLAVDTAQALVFYAFHPDQLYMERLLANLPDHQRRELFASVEEVRRTGYATAVNARGIAVLAAPIFDSSGLCAALALLATRDVLSTEAGSAELRTLCATAAELTEEVGGSSPSADRRVGDHHASA